MKAADESSGRDRELIREALRAAAEEDGAAAADAAACVDDPSAPAPGQPSADGGAPSDDAFPDYEILREISHGGQGVVLLAIQKTTKQQVAIKVPIEGPYASASARRRFEREVELAAQLKHPDIVSVLHAGQTRDGRPFYVMEYVPGTPLTTWVHETRPPLREFLRLFERVCEAVQYAHQRGIIHRDLKPSNILIQTRTEAQRHDGAKGDEPRAAGVPKVLDFGLAKWLTGPADTRASLTHAMVGTLPYMSPEQTRGNPDEIDTRTDIYSLGVLLYEALTGAYPYPVIGEMADVLRHISETPPTPPSRAWSAERGIAIGRPHRSALRSAGTAWFFALGASSPLDDEIETIALKCLSKERARRYQTAHELARDIRHYLAGEPIEAKRDSAWYVLRKQLRSHWIPASGLTAFVLVLIGTLSFAVVHWQRAEHWRRTYANTLDDLAQMLRTEGDRQRAERLWRHAIEVYRRNGLEQHWCMALLLTDLALLEQERFNDAAAESLFREALPIAAATRGRDDAQYAQILSSLGATLNRLGRPLEAEKHLRAALAVFGRASSQQDKSSQLDKLYLASCQENLARVLLTRQDFEAADQLCREALAVRRSLPGQPGIDDGLVTAARVKLAQLDYAGAEPLLRECLEVRRTMFPPNHWAVGNVASLLGESLSALTRDDEAEPLLIEGVTTLRQAGDQPRSIQALERLVRFYNARGRTDQAAIWRATTQPASQPAASSSQSNSMGAMRRRPDECCIGAANPRGTHAPGLGFGTIYNFYNRASDANPDYPLAFVVAVVY